MGEFMAEWWPTILIVVITGILLLSLLGGIAEMAGFLKYRSSRVAAYAILSVFLFPAMFTSCGLINRLGENGRDVFGFEYAEFEERPGGISTRSARRERLVENAFSFITSAHGIISILTALIVAVPFAWCFLKLNEETAVPESYWAVVVPLAIFALVFYGRS